MARTIRFHLDENCDPRIAVGLALHGVAVTMTAEAGLLQASDETQLAYAVAQDRMVVTQDTDFLRMARPAGRHQASLSTPIRDAPSGRSSVLSSLSGKRTTPKRWAIASSFSEFRGTCGQCEIRRGRDEPSSTGTRVTARPRQASL